MKIPLLLPCECGLTQTIHIDADESSFDWTCDRCKENHSCFFDNEFTKSDKILRRAGAECKQEEFAISIILSALAFECELSRLFMKWKDIEALRRNEHFDAEAAGEELRNLRSIKKKISFISTYLDPTGIDDVVRQTPAIEKHLKAVPTLKVGELIDGLEKVIFYPRNEIMHLGRTNQTKTQAMQALNASQIGLWICQELDHRKRSGPG